MVWSVGGGEASVRDEHCLADSPPVFAGIICALGAALRSCLLTG